MLPIKTVMVVLEAHKDAQPVWLQAQAWAQALGATLQVLVPVAPDVKESLELAPSLQEMADRNAEAAAGHWLDTLLAKAPAGTGQTIVATMQRVETVLHEARRLEADLLLVGQREDMPDLRPLMRQLPCPLLIVRRTAVSRRFAAAIGAGAEDARHKLLNQALLERLVALTLRFQGDARVLSALPNPVELVPLMGDAYAASYVANDLEASYRENLGQQIAAFGLVADGALKVAPGRPDLVIPELVKSEKVDCLLLGTVARKGLSAFWLGNTAEDVLPRVDCDVLLLRPQDYEDPS